jgi:hypothetical protein
MKKYTKFPKEKLLDHRRNHPLFECWKPLLKKNCTGCNEPWIWVFYPSNTGILDYDDNFYWCGNKMCYRVILLLSTGGI